MTINTYSILFRQALLSSLKVTFSYCLSVAAIVIFSDIICHAVMRYFHLPDGSISMDFLNALFVEHYLPIYLFFISLAAHLTLSLVNVWSAKFK